MYRFFLLIYLFFCINLSHVEATHIVGGELNYECLGNNNYKIRLKIYRDCLTGVAPFDNPAYMSVFDGSGNLVNTFTINFPGATPVPGLINNPCFTAPTNICVEEGIYETTINLPPNSNGYHLAYQRCCRNNTILNIIDPQNSGATYTAFIPPSSTVVCNSNPVFNEFPPVFLCLGAPLVFDHSASDSDGDSLVYEICDPFLGATPFDPMPFQTSTPPFSFVNWAPPYNSSYPMSTIPPLNIDPQTGLLTGTPNMVGQWVIGICVKEYRNGLLVSENKRDFQFNVLNCPDLIVASVPTQQTFCDGLTVNFNNTSLNASSYLWDFGVPGANSTLQNPSYTYPDTGNYTVTLIANPNTVCADTAQTIFSIYPKLETQFTVPDSQCLSGNSFDFLALGNHSSSASINWDFGGNASLLNSSNNTLQNISFNNAGPHLVSLEISDYGCTDYFEDTIWVLHDPIAEITSQEDFCIGLDVDFKNNSQNAHTYYWDFDDNNMNSNQFEPSYLYPDTGVYNVMLVASNNYCSDTTYESFRVYPLLKTEIIGDTTACFAEQNFNFSAAGSKTEYCTYEWDIPDGNIIFSTDSFVNNIVFDTTGVFPVSLTITENGCSDTKTINVYVANPPIADFDADPRQGCRPLEVNFQNQSYTETSLNYLWQFGDGTNSTIENPSHNYLIAGLYNISLTVESTEICFKSSSINKENYIQVFDLPTSIFSVSPEETSIFDPFIEINDQSINNINSTYYLEDTIVNLFDYTHEFVDTGYHLIKQIVVDENTCKDTSLKEIYINPEFRFYIPNTFTPNNDGKNDFFKPELIGVKNYEFRIYNRWGELVFLTENQKASWDGKTRKNTNAPQGVYVYWIKIKNDLKQEYIYNGHVNLIR